MLINKSQTLFILQGLSKSKFTVPDFEFHISKFHASSFYSEVRITIIFRARIKVTLGFVQKGKAGKWNYGKFNKSDELKAYFSPSLVYNLTKLESSLELSSQKLTVKSGKCPRPQRWRSYRGGENVIFLRMVGKVFSENSQRTSPILYQIKSV